VTKLYHELTYLVQLMSTWTLDCPNLEQRMALFIALDGRRWWISLQ